MKVCLAFLIAFPCVSQSWMEKAADACGLPHGMQRFASAHRSVIVLSNFGGVAGTRWSSARISALGDVVRHFPRRLARRHNRDC